MLHPTTSINILGLSENRILSAEPLDLTVDQCLSLLKWPKDGCVVLSSRFFDTLTHNIELVMYAIL